MLCEGQESHWGYGGRRLAHFDQEATWACCLRVLGWRPAALPVIFLSVATPDGAESPHKIKVALITLCLPLESSSLLHHP